MPSRSREKQLALEKVVRLCPRDKLASPSFRTACQGLFGPQEQARLDSTPWSVRRLFKALSWPTRKSSIFGPGYADWSSRFFVRGILGSQLPGPLCASEARTGLQEVLFGGTPPKPENGRFSSSLWMSGMFVQEIRLFL